MEGCAKALLIITLLATAGAQAAATTLQPLGASATLRSLALSARAQAAPGPREPAPPLRRALPRARNATPAGAVAAAPLHPLPSGPGTPGLPRVRTGAGLNVDGLRAGGGHVGAALGDLQYVQLADGKMAIYRKGDGALLLGPIAANAMYFDAAPGSAAAACGAARVDGAAVQFDQLANRWLVSHRARHDGLHYLCIAVSVSADAGAAYHRYALPIAPYFDDPRLAVWPDAYYLSVSLFDGSAGRYLGPRICGIERQALLRGGAAPVRCRDLGDTYAPLAPVSLEGYATAPQGASPALFLALDIDAAGRGERLLLWRFSFSTDQLAQASALPVAPFIIACPSGAACVGQPAPGGMLAAMGERLAPRPVFRNDKEHATVLAAHAIQIANGQLALRWYEIGDPLAAARVYQQGSLAPDGSSRWSGSIGMDKAGNIALGYAVAAPDTHPGIRYTGRQRTDPPGRMQAEQVVFNGDGAQDGQAAPELDGGALALDPIDGCTFWYTQRYLPSSGPANWRTRIASFKFEACR